MRATSVVVQLIYRKADIFFFGMAGKPGKRRRKKTAGEPIKDPVF